MTYGEEHCPAPGCDEQRALDRIQAEGNVRLACQLRPSGDISARPLLSVKHEWWRAAPPARTIVERLVAVLLFDVRCTDAGGQSGHDTIFALEGFHAIAGTAIKSAGGVQCRQAGSSWMALFGLAGSDVHDASLRALGAVREIEERSTDLTGRLAFELGLAASFSLVVHVGPVVAGAISERGEGDLSAVGEGIRAAERLRVFAQQHAARFVISKPAADAAGIIDPALDWRRVGGGATGLAMQALGVDSSAGVLALLPASPS